MILHLQTFGQLTQDSILNILQFRETTLYIKFYMIAWMYSGSVGVSTVTTGEENHCVFSLGGRYLEVLGQNRILVIDFKML